MAAYAAITLTTSVPMCAFENYL